MASNNTPAQAPQWTVIGVNPTTDVENGNPVKGNTVNFRTAAGNRGSVFVPDTVANLDAARDIIAARVAHVDGLASLTG